ncbi:MAG TPA: DNA ligase D, partial [Nannocystis sp.]
PALATLVDRLPDDDRWLHELKFDGYRLLARVDGDDIKLITRGDQDWTARLAPIADALRQRLAGRKALVDGELVHLDADGVSRFGPLQRALADGRPDTLFYYAFDLLHLDGRDLRPLPLERRKQLLAELFPPTAVDSRLRLSQHIEGHAEELLARVCELGLEGLIAKKRDAPYRSGRTRDWLKVKCGRRQEVVVGGFAPARSGPRAIGALLVGVFDDRGDLRYCGKVGTGFDHDEAARLYERLAARAISRSPFADKLPPPVARSRFVRPELVVEVRFAEWTADGHMREPVYEGLREDKDPRAVRREQARPATPRGAVQVLGVTLTHPDRVVFPEGRLTKRDLAEYFEKVASWILPHVRDRPLSLVRCPDGLGRPCFFQRHLRHELPAGVETADLDPDEDTAYVYVRDARGLVALAQFGVLELHVWGSTVADPDHPDRLVLDLDPDEHVSWDMLKSAATAVRDRLAALDLASFLKTTGGKGLHIVVPLTGAPDWPTVKRFARAVADDLARREPDRYVAVASKARRRGKIYIDYLRNDRGATSIAPYSPRARPGAPVAVPLRWSELARLP